MFSYLYGFLLIIACEPECMFNYGHNNKILPEGQWEVSYKSIALAHQESAIAHASVFLQFVLSITPASM